MRWTSFRCVRASRRKSCRAFRVMRLKLNFVLEVSELLEVCVRCQSIVPGWPEKCPEHVEIGSRHLSPSCVAVGVTTKTIPIKLVWAAAGRRAGTGVYSQADRVGITRCHGTRVALNSPVPGLRNRWIGVYESHEVVPGDRRLGGTCVTLSVTALSCRYDTPAAESKRHAAGKSPDGT